MLRPIANRSRVEKPTTGTGAPAEFRIVPRYEVAGRAIIFLQLTSCCLLSDAAERILVEIF
jgi:hypothetical protein